MNRWHWTFEFIDTEKEAYDRECREWSLASAYVRKHFPPHYTPWTSRDGKEHKFCFWYAYKA